MYGYLLALTVASAAGLQGWGTLYNNFAFETVGLNGFQIGGIQSVREIPGLLALFVIFLTVFVKEQRVSALSIICMGIGIMLTGFLPTFSGLLLCTLIMSFGFHYYETTNQSLILQYFDEYQSPLVMGKQRSMMSLVSVVVGVAIFLVSGILSYAMMFLGIGIMVFFVGLWCSFKMPRNENIHKQHKQMVLKRKYSLFYILTLLSGARRQIFMVFSVFLLVKKFGFTVQQVTLLFVANNIVNYFAAPFVAKLIKRYGERKILSWEYGSLIIIFISYAHCPDKYIVAGLYMLDHIAFNGSMAIRTYFQKIAEKKDISSSTAVSFTINHLAAVVLPVIGGYLWMIDYRIPFYMGALLGAISFCAAMFIKLPAVQVNSCISK
ncbi:MAG: MFS transporter [Candidatus Omnitrophica bacterium]|nr:MFS transporter [Candidatus Omnitrophota bacterium]